MQAFLGEVATWTGIVTGTLMFASPALFTRWKWKGVAGATPAFMLWTGVPFFVGCTLYNIAHPTQGVGTAALRALVIVGAILQVLLYFEPLDVTCTNRTSFGPAVVAHS